MLDLAGEVSGNGLEADVLCVVHVVDGSGEVGGDTLLLTVFALTDKYGVSTKVYSY